MTVSVLLICFAFNYHSIDARGEQLSTRHYDVNDGLVHSRVNCIYQDGKGYVWFGTWEGLSRFDGYRFVNYGREDGLPGLFITAMTEDRQGRLWVATNVGLARLFDEAPEDHTPLHQTTVPPPRKKFAPYRISESVPSNSINSMGFDSANNLWCYTDAGLYRAASDTLSAPQFELEDAGGAGRDVGGAMLIDGGGQLWIGARNGLMEVDERGRLVKYGAPDGFAEANVAGVVEAPEGKLLVAYESAVFEFVRPPNVGEQGTWSKLPVSVGQGRNIEALAVAAGGTLWVGTEDGLIKYHSGQQTTYTTAQGLSDDLILSLFTDRDGNVWLGSSSGVNKLPSEVLTSFTKADGLTDQFVTRITEARDGSIYANTSAGGVFRIVGEKLVAVPGSQRPPFDKIGKRLIQDRRGDWWAGTQEGLFRFTGPDLQFTHGRKFTSADGIPEAPVFAGGLYEAPDGKLWVSLSDFNLYWLDPSDKDSPVFNHLSLKEYVDKEGGLPVGGFLDMRSDASGALWLASFGFLGRLVRGRLESLDVTEALPELQPRFLFPDSRGRLWIGLRWGGVSRLDDPSSEPLKFVNYSTADGLVSDTVWAMTEDNDGRIYFGTGRGLDQFDASTGRIRHFNKDDGLAGNLINYCLRDRHGNIWIATNSGLSRYEPHAEVETRQRIPIYLSHIQAGDENLPLPERGTVQGPEVTLTAAQNRLLIEYVAPNYGGAASVRYQYQLEGSDKGWSPPGDQRSVNYAGLAPGSYTFMVRAVTPEGVSNSQPAAISFRILPPVWQRWWFITLAAALMVAGIVMLYRVRIRQVLAMERIRRQIALDLHDDVGAGLSQVAILSEVAKRENALTTGEHLNEIGDLARSMRDSISDIVWAVDPRRDTLGDLVQRMKQVAFNLLEADGLRVEFRAPEEPDLARVNLAPDRRRHVLLIFKETVNNVARHARASRVWIEIRLDAHQLRLSVRDDGRGFDTKAEHQGHGLRGVRQRAAELGAILKSASTSGVGTTIEITVPLRRE